MVPFGELLAEPWFWPVAIVIVGVPIVLLILTEIHSELETHGKAGGARLIRLLRNWLVPVGALLLLLSQTQFVSGGVDWVKVLATAFGFLVVLALLNSVNLFAFSRAAEGSWRRRLPKIFIDLGRALLIVIAVALLFSWVWGADIGGLFTALGIGSIVIGLALQNAIGPIAAGLFLLFERPFEVGDWLITSDGKGKVLEINWRATHFETNNGIRVVPNASLAGDSIVNLTRASSTWSSTVEVRFSTDDPPDEVIALLVSVASQLPQAHPDDAPAAIPAGKTADQGSGWYEASIPLIHPGMAWGAGGLFRRRLWYAARRAGLHLDGDTFDPFTTPERTREALARIAPRLYLEQHDVDSYAEQSRLLRYGEGEVVQHAHEVPDGVRFIVTGMARMSAAGPAGEIINIADFGRDDVLGLTSLTRQGIASRVVALEALTVLYIPVESLDRMVATRRELARDFGREVDTRRERTLEAFKKAGYVPPAGSRLIAY